jgi:hypothetical protein
MHARHGPGTDLPPSSPFPSPASLPGRFPGDDQPGLVGEDDRLDPVAQAELGETIGWPAQVALAGRLYGSLPAPERAHTTILTGNYGEAGAIDRYGRQSGLPGVYSGANTFWLWGPPPAADTSALAVNVDPALPRSPQPAPRQGSAG